MKGGFGCSCCAPDCEECTRTCTEPHTGDAFEVVYSLYNLGAEAGNPTDGYLEADGDSDTSDPYDGMDGDGPWSQNVSGSFSLGPTTTRYPCYVRVSFWRSNFVLGAATIPPPSADLTVNEITITNTGLAPIVVGGGIVLEPGESYEVAGQIPLVTGAGDQSENDPRGFGGSMSFSAACANDIVTASISATIAWNVKKRQHVLYGIVRECYEDPENPPCATYCDGDPAPDVLYLTISNMAWAGTALPLTASAEGTYVFERTPNLCSVYQTPWPQECSPGIFGTDDNAMSLSTAGFYGNRSNIIDYGTFTACFSLTLSIPAASITSLCGAGVLASGSNGTASIEGVGGGSFDWEIST